MHCFIFVDFVIERSKQVLTNKKEGGILLLALKRGEC